MRELTNRAKTDIIKLYGGAAWIEIIEIKLPDYFIPTDKEKEFLSLSPDNKWHILITNVQNYDYVMLPAANWQTEGLQADYKCFFGVPYERDQVSDTNEQQGQMNSRITLGDTGGIIKSIVDRADGLYGCEVKVGFTMQNEDSLLDKIEVYDPEVVLEFTVSSIGHDLTNFICILSSDTPLEWKFPARTMLKNVCHFQFRGLECGFTGDIVQKVMSSRKAGGITDVFNGHWAINGGFIEKLNPDGSSVMESILSAANNDFLHIESDANGAFFAVREGSNYFHSFNGTTLHQFNTSAERVIKHEDYPFERTISSGGATQAYAITNTATTRYLYRFNEAVRARIGTGTAWQYFNMVSSPDIDLCFAIQGGTYSGTTFTASNQKVGRLIKVEGTGTSVTDLYPGKRWKWVNAVSENLLYALYEDNYLWCFKDTGGSLTAYQVNFVNDWSNYLQLTGMPTGKTFSIHSESGTCFLIDNKKLYVIEEETVFRTNDTAEWYAVKALDDIDAAFFNSDGVGVGDGKELEYGTARIIPAKGDVKSLLGVANYNFHSPSFYYVVGGEIHLYEHKDFKTCNHTLTDCKERGNEVRFGGYPGIGSGGLTK